MAPPTGPSEGEWASHKAEIEKLFIEDDMTRKQLMKHMEGKHNFHASDGQYTRRFKKWGFKKNLKHEEWEAMSRQVLKRKDQGKDSELVRDGETISAMKFRKGLYRNKLPLYEQIQARIQSISPIPPESRLLVRTPPAEMNMVSLQVPKRIRYSNSPWAEFREMIKTIVEQISANPRSVGIGEPCSPYLEPADANSLFGDQSYALVDGMQSASSSVMEWSPSDTDIGWLLQDLETASRIARTMPFTTAERRNLEVRELFASLFNVDVHPQSADYLSALLPKMRTLAIESPVGAFESDLQSLCSPTSLGAVFQLLSYTAFLSSNNRLPGAILVKLVSWVVSQDILPLLDSLMALQTPVTNKLGSDLLLGACCIGNQAMVQLLLARKMNLNGVSNRGSPALAAALMHRNWKIAHKLLEAGAELGLEGIDISLTLAIEDFCDLSMASKLIHKGSSLNSYTYMDRFEGTCYTKTPLTAAIVRGELAFVELLLRSGADIDYVGTSSDAGTLSCLPLQLAVKCSNLGIVQCLLHHGASVNLMETFPAQIGKYHRVDIRTPLQIASRLNNDNWELVELLLAAGANVNARPWIGHRRAMRHSRCTIIGRPMSALSAAAAQGNRNTIRLLLNAKADVNDLSATYSPLCSAIRGGYIDIALDFLHLGADPNGRNSGSPYLSPLEAAVDAGSIEMLRLLLEFGADVNAEATLRKERLSLVGRAAKRGSIDMVEFLLNAGTLIIPSSKDLLAFVNLQLQDRGSTCEENQFLSKRLLVASVHYHPATRDILRHSVVIAAIERGDAFLSAALFCRSTGLSELHTDPSAANRWLDPSMEQFYRDQIEFDRVETKFHPLVFATKMGFLQQLRSHMPCKLQLNKEQAGVQQGMLLAAAKKGHFELVEELIDTPAEFPPDLWNEILGAAFTRCCNRVQTLQYQDDVRLELESLKALISLLIEKKRFLASPSDRDPQWSTPLTVAIELSDRLPNFRAETANIVKTLLAAGADPDIILRPTICPTLAAGWLIHSPRAIHCAVCWENIDLLMALIDHGADVDAPVGISSRWHYYRKYPLSIAINRGNIAIVRHLLSSGADVNASPQVLFSVIDHGRFTIGSLLLDHGADINLVNANIERAYTGTGLHKAAVEGTFEACEWLLDNGADVNAMELKDIERNTALHSAAQSGHIPIVKLLLERGADPSLLNIWGFTPLEQAAQSGRLDTVHLLLENDDDLDKLEAQCERVARFAAENGEFAIAEYLEGYALDRLRREERLDVTDGQSHMALGNEPETSDLEI